MALDYRNLTTDERLTRLESERWRWMTAGIVAIVLGMALFTAGLWALHRAGLY